MNTAAELAAFLDLSVGELRRLSGGHSNYTHFTIPKRSGAPRTISAPVRALARAQRRVLNGLLSGDELHPAASSPAHGFVSGRGIVTGALPHVGKRVVANIDIKDFFPSVAEWHVSRVFRSLGHGGEAAELLARLCTEPVPGGRCLPQGACTSPVLSNAVCRHLDERLSRLCARGGFGYTRYADDLSFSGDDLRGLRGLLRGVEAILKAEGYAPHPDKTRIMPQGRRQKVTGLVVNEKPAVPRRERRRLRAILHNAGRTGGEAQNRDGHEDYKAHLRGKVAFVTMVDPTKAEKLLTAFDSISWSEDSPRAS